MRGISTFRSLIFSCSPRTRPLILRAKRCMLYLKTVGGVSEIVRGVFRKNRPLLIHTTKVIATFGFRHLRTTEKGRDKSIPPWAYKMHRISSISGWYEPLDGSSSLDVGAGADAGSGL